MHCTKFLSFSVFSVCHFVGWHTKNALRSETWPGRFRQIHLPRLKYHRRGPLQLARSTTRRLSPSMITHRTISKASCKVLFESEWCHYWANSRTEIALWLGLFLGALLIVHPTNSCYCTTSICFCTLWGGLVPALPKFFLTSTRYASQKNNLPCCPASVSQKPVFERRQRLAFVCIYGVTHTYKYGQ